jgi:hypothetical protein
MILSKQLVKAKINTDIIIIDNFYYSYEDAINQKIITKFNNEEMITYSKKFIIDSLPKLILKDSIIFIPIEQYKFIDKLFNEKNEEINAIINKNNNNDDIFSIYLENGYSFNMSTNNKIYNNTKIYTFNDLTLNTQLKINSELYFICEKNKVSNKKLLDFNLSKYSIKLNNADFFQLEKEIFLSSDENTIN